MQIPASPGVGAGLAFGCRKASKPLHAEFNLGPPFVLGDQGRSPHRLSSMSCSQCQRLLTGTRVLSVIFVAGCMLAGAEGNGRWGWGDGGGRVRRKEGKAKKRCDSGTARLTLILRGILEAVSLS